MSLQDELVELNAVYQSVQEKNEALRLENEALRALVREYLALAADLVVHVPIGAKRITKIEELQDRAQTLLREEQTP